MSSLDAPLPSSEDTIHAVTDAVSALRAGRAVILAGDEGHFRLLAVETLPDQVSFSFNGWDLLLTESRARTLKIPPYTGDLVALPLQKTSELAWIKALADPTSDLDSPLKGPFEPRRDGLPASYGAALKLAKLAGLLPAMLVQKLEQSEAIVSLRLAHIQTFDAALTQSLKIVTRAHVPLADAEQAELVSFRPGDGGPEHYAIVIGAPSSQQAVLTRLHSECFTGDLLGSLKCDCGEQLRGAIKLMRQAGGGILLYLAQEGRGIGLVNKLRAYRLQDQGFDTIEANERLGFESDERVYGIAARMLSLLGHRKIKLLTNNPEKLAALTQYGIEIEARVPHAFAGNDHNRAYLDTKAKKAGHLL